ncbi:MAG: alpha-galactosidase, partial [Bryobacteraceae bacterium]
MRPALLILSVLLPFTIAAAPWRLSTADTEVVVAVVRDAPILHSLRRAGSPVNWLSRPIAERLPAEVTVAGRVAKPAWKFVDASEAAGELRLRFESAEPALLLESIWRARPGEGPVEHWLTLTNRTGRTITIGHQDSLRLEGLRTAPAEKASVWWVNRGGNNASRQGGVFVEPVNEELDQSIVSNPQDGSSPVPWMAVQVGESRGLYVGWEFSGIGRIHAKVTNAAAREFDVSVGLTPDFRTDVAAGETFLVPPAFVGCYRGGLDEGAYSLHRYVLDKLLPPFPAGRVHPTLAYNLFLDSGGYKATEPDVLRSAAVCKDLGFETFVPDAMWFAGVGDWRWDPVRFPAGVKPIGAFVREGGMRLGLWMAWTNAGISEHPGAINVRRQAGWIIEPAPENWKPGPFIGKRICLANPEAHQWALKETQRVVEEYGIDYLKHDIDPIQTRCEQTTHRHKYGVDVSYWNALAYYDVQESLKRRFPNLELEGCSHGGCVKDFGYIKRVHYIVTTDTLSSLPNRQSLWDSTYAMPPAVLQAYTYENHYNRDSDRPRPYFWRSAMMGAWQIDPTNTRSWTAEEKAG